MPEKSKTVMDYHFLSPSLLVVELSLLQCNICHSAALLIILYSWEVHWNGKNQPQKSYISFQLLYAFV